MTVEQKLKLFKSDLKDAKDAKLLKKYPHLNDPKHIRWLECKIAQLECEMLADALPR